VGNIKKKSFTSYNGTSGTRYWKVASGNYDGTPRNQVKMSVHIMRVDDPTSTHRLVMEADGNSLQFRPCIDEHETGVSYPRDLRVYKNTSDSTFDIYIQAGSYTYVDVEMIYSGSGITVYDTATWETAEPTTSGTYLLQFTNGNLNAMKINNSGNVGIGTTSPGTALQISRSFTGAGDTSAMISFENTALNYYDWQIGPTIIDNGASFVIKGGADGFGNLSNIFVIRGTSVGIGTTNPIVPLHVNGSINMTRDDYTGGPALGFINPDGSYSGWVGFGSSTINQMRMVSNNNYPITFWTNATGNGEEKMRINANGNVGIGTTNPSVKLELFKEFVAQDLYDTATLKFSTTNGSANWDVGSVRGAVALNNGGTSNYPGGLVFATKVPGSPSDALVDRMVIDANGNVGIGTTNPATKLHVFHPTYGVHRSIYWNERPGNPATQNPLRMGYLGSSDPSYASGGLGLFKNTYEGQVEDEAVRIQANGKSWFNGGNVGIGTTNPITPLHVNGTASSNFTATSYYVKGGTTIATQPNPQGWNVSIYGSGDIVAGQAIASNQGTLSASDTRIKNNIVDADDAECLETLRLLKPKKYQYRDDIGRGQEPVWGFIAQEVRETLPYATQLRKDVIPNIYELANVSSSNVITFTNFNTSNLESNATTLIRTKCIDGKDHDIHLVEVIDEHTIRVEEDLSEWTGSVDETGNVVAGNQLFIYGQEVDDFMFLKKDAIWTVATSALQEVDRQQQADKVRIAELETQLASVLTRLDALESA
jgi:hypothetical protein